MRDENERIAYLARIARQHYEEGISQEDLAAELGLPVEEVARLIAEAESKGVVNVQVRSPWRTNPALEEELVKKFNLKDARVLVRENRTYEEMVEGLGLLAAQYFADILTPHAIIGISWGSALHHMIQALPSRHLPEAEVVQLIGATGAENISTDGPMLAQMLAERIGARARYLHSPLIVESEAGRNALLQERSIRQTLLRAEQADIALVGIGTTNPALYSLLRAGYVTREELDAIRAAGAVGDVCAQHYSADGEWLDISINRRAVGVSLHTLGKIPTVIGVAGGAEKAETILGALRGQHVNVLITDDEAVERLLALDAGIPERAAPSSITEAAQRPLVSLKGIWKVFNGVPVLHGVDIELMPGEIHALLGGNGSGKSTLMKVLSGVYTADAGAIELNGVPVEISGPAEAHDLGIYYVPQEPKIFAHLSVQENLLLGMDETNKAEAVAKIRRLAQEIGFDGDIQAAAGSLNIANQQLLEIIRGLLRDAQVLILDEPTSTLTFREVGALFERMRHLAQQGIGIFFISHRLNEILEISDRISVLREGRFVLHARTSEVTTRDLIRAMLPEQALAEEAQEAPRERAAIRTGKDVLRVENLSGEAFRDVSLEVRAGEVVGLAGLVGAGRTELARAILGIEQETAGRVWINGVEATKRSPARCQKLGLVYVPEDRHAHGIFADLAYPYTTTASILERLGRWFLSARQEKHIVEDFVRRLQIKTREYTQAISTLSGGNQQKVVLSKALAGDPKVIILDEPTRGVDAQARQDVYRLIEALKAEGVGILMISSDIEEVIQVSDRVLVMFHGSIVDELNRSECQIERITAASFGVKST